MTLFAYNRRKFIHSVALGASALYVPGVFAEQLTKTPSATEGPFYPTKLPLDTDNDLLKINENINPAVGSITHLTGQIMDIKGNPVRNAVIEIWQVDNKGVYLHPGSNRHNKRDTNFQGFGRCLTSRKGEYYFRTIKPTPYPGRTPHIHFIVKHKNKKLLTSQLYVKGEKQNKTDGLLNRIKDPKQKASVIVDFKPIKDSKLGELAANFNIVLGHTPSDS